MSAPFWQSFSLFLTKVEIKSLDSRPKNYLLFIEFLDTNKFVNLHFELATIILRTSFTMLDGSSKQNLIDSPQTKLKSPSYSIRIQTFFLRKQTKNLWKVFFYQNIVYLSYEVRIDIRFLIVVFAWENIYLLCKILNLKSLLWIIWNHWLIGCLINASV